MVRSGWRGRATARRRGRVAPPRRPPCSSPSLPSGCATDRFDDLGAVDPLQVDAGNPQVAMAELALDRHQRLTLVGKLDSLRMPQLMRCEPSAHARRFRWSPQLFAGGAGLPAPTCGRAMDHAEQRPDRERGAELLPWGQRVPGPAVHAHLAPPSSFASAHGEGAAGAVKVGLGEVECFADSQSGSPEQDDPRP